jgi:hypothetical protein
MCTNGRQQAGKAATRLFCRALTQLDQELTPIRLVAERLAIDNSVIDPQTGAALISHRPQIGPEAYACVIFPGVEAAT